MGPHLGQSVHAVHTRYQEIEAVTVSLTQCGMPLRRKLVVDERSEDQGPLRSAPLPDRHCLAARAEQTMPDPG